MYDSFTKQLVAFSIQNEGEFKHYGKGHDDNPPGRGSGAHPYGSGKNPFQHDPKARAKWLKEKKASSGEVHIARTDGSRAGRTQNDTHDMLRLYKNELADVTKTDWEKREAHRNALHNATIGKIKTGHEYNKLSKKGLMTDKTKKQYIKEQQSGETDRKKLDDLRRKELKVDKKTGFFLKNKKEKGLTPDQDMMNDTLRVNPSYSATARAPYGNTTACAIAYDMRRRGYDVRAKNMSSPLFNAQLAAFYPEGKVYGISTKKSLGQNLKTDLSRQKFAESFDKYPAGARGIVRTSSYNSTKGTVSGIRDYNYERVTAGKDKTKTYFIDACAGKRYDMSKASDRKAVLKNVNNVNTMRTDNLWVNMKRMREVCE